MLQKRDADRAGATVSSDVPAAAAALLSGLITKTPQEEVGRHAWAAARGDP